jgi:hypothetical protein
MKSRVGVTFKVVWRRGMGLRISVYDSGHSFRKVFIHTALRQDVADTVNSHYWCLLVLSCCLQIRTQTNSLVSFSLFQSSSVINALSSDTHTGWTQRCVLCRLARIWRSMLLEFMTRAVLSSMKCSQKMHKTDILKNIYCSKNFFFFVFVGSKAGPSGRAV